MVIVHLDSSLHPRSDEVCDATKQAKNNNRKSRSFRSQVPHAIVMSQLRENPKQKYHTIRKPVNGIWYYYTIKSAAIEKCSGLK